MLDRTPALTQAVDTNYWLDADGIPIGALWAEVDERLNAGYRVWLTGAVLARLSEQFGVARDGRNWLLLVPPAAHPYEGLYRARDVLLAGTALVALAPVMAILAVLVKLSSPGPIFYSTHVLGELKKPFLWFKFRSMRVRPEEDEREARRQQFREYAERKTQGKVIDKTRVTSIGKFLRKYSLDELPQLWNVLQGQMTLVGPRPCLPYEAELFPDWAQRRFSVRPGLTGIWQVFGRNRVSLEEGLAMDLVYTYKHSFWLDLEIMARTFQALLSREGGI